MSSCLHIDNEVYCKGCGISVSQVGAYHESALDFWWCVDCEKDKQRANKRPWKTLPQTKEA